MLFSSQLFILAFLPLSVLVFHLAAGSQTLRTSVLLIASTIFYAWWDPRFLPLLMGSIAVNWLLIRAYFSSGAKIYISLGIGFNLALLGLFKYANFFAENILTIVGITHQQWSIILPLGISFFTFQQISYLIDVKRGEANKYSLIDYATYVSFFPQLIAGPIVRHGELIPQFANNPKRREVAELAARGTVLFTLGLVKKVFFADELAPIADEGFATAHAISSADAWTSAVAYSLQLYFDFSSYSDMAIGLGAMFGLKLPINFDAPYKSTNIRIFWRRWHITLSNFLRDYVYIPLGGSHGGLMATCIVVMVTMLLCGLWHGAGWTFIAWGVLHGVGICINRFWLATKIRMPGVLAWCMTTIFVVVCWVLFRAQNFDEAAGILSSMFASSTMPNMLFDVDDWVYVAIGVSFALLGPTNVELVRRKFVQSASMAILTALVLVLVCLRIGQGRGLEFIYFQF